MDEIDVVVQWDRDKSKNTVALNDLVLRKNASLKIGATVKMKWRKGWWKGRVEQIISNREEEPMDIEGEGMTEEDDSEEDEEDDDENVPLASYVKRICSIPQIEEMEVFTELSAGGQGYAVQQEQPRTVVQSHLAEELMDTEVEEITEEEDSEDDDENVPLASYRRVTLIEGGEGCAVQPDHPFTVVQSHLEKNSLLEECPRLPPKSATVQEQGRVTLIEGGEGCAVQPDHPFTVVQSHLEKNSLLEECPRLPPKSATVQEQGRVTLIEGGEGCAVQPDHPLTVVQSHLEKNSLLEECPRLPPKSATVQEQGRVTLIEGGEGCAVQPDHPFTVVQSHLEKNSLLEECPRLPPKSATVQEQDIHDPDQPSCESLLCEGEVFAACFRCQALLCFEHFDNSEECDCHGLNTQDPYLENFQVDGYDEILVQEHEKNCNENVHLSKSGSVKSKNKIVKELRNKGEPYLSEKSRKTMAGRKNLPFKKCDSYMCELKRLECNIITQEVMKNVREDFYGLGTLTGQREYIARHISTTPNKKGLRKNLTYFLPSPINPGHRLPVCQKTFLTTLGISTRQVRTVLAKTCNKTGTMEKDRRGGKQNLDPTQKEKIITHLHKFPRVPSHYCRANSEFTYVAPDLTKAIMYQLFVKEHGNCASRSTYVKAMKSMKIKIHKPKKDMCGLCSNYTNAQGQLKEDLKEVYDAHRAEVEKVRGLKAQSKEKAISSDQFASAVFDLQQVMYLPKSNRSEIFYKRRLACYNLTVYDFEKRDGLCYLSNETITKRGSNEIASYLLDYLREVDKKGVKEVDFYSDGCAGQNRNSVLPAMAMAFMKECTNVAVITFHYFEKCHGQSECDSIHSHIEQRLSKSHELMHPVQLSSIIREARSNPGPYRVKCVRTQDILSWRSYSQQLGILRTRTSDEGVSVDWTMFKQVQLKKECPMQIFFKTSHLQDQYNTLSIGQGRRRNPAQSLQLPGQLYESRPKLSQEKYGDLVSLCRGSTPVIIQPELVEYYENLPH
ncbi:uncharacterized protein LOC115918229 isoform X2 [Strongylocentrotus purpuratus]|uniref:Uncharacterized protein n=1 Tax=Strongylocentrotus purpuratus TaxID=7668 RepID=A0A7M7SU89_STRPU|nr:uncharacterized protein LOC115918229 isoform X2 [Strongylocentrotus purpuratus]